MQATSQAVTAAPARWTIDPNHTLVEFTVRHMMITTVRGRFHGVTGSVHLDDENPARSSVEVSIPAASIETGSNDRDNHLRSADFLEVERHPYLRFRSLRIEGDFRKPGDRFVIVGELTIRGTTREVALQTTYEGGGVDPWGVSKRSFSATLRIDRRDYGLTWNRALETGGLFVGNDVDIALEVQLEAA